MLVLAAGQDTATVWAKLHAFHATSMVVELADHFLLLDVKDFHSTVDVSSCNKSAAWSIVHAVNVPWVRNLGFHIQSAILGVDVHKLERQLTCYELSTILWVEAHPPWIDCCCVAAIRFIYSHVTQVCCVKLIGIQSKAWGKTSARRLVNVVYLEAPIHWGSCNSGPRRIESRLNRSQLYRVIDHKRWIIKTNRVLSLSSSYHLIQIPTKINKWH